MLCRRCTSFYSQKFHSRVPYREFFLLQDKHLSTHNPSTIDENDERKCNHNEQSISPTCTSKSKSKNAILKWNELHSSLQYALPPDDDYSYVVETYQEIDDVAGDSPHFSATIRINIISEEDAKQWMKKMSNHSTCTYRTTKTVKTSNKRVKCKFAKHCQHFAKKLTQNKKRNQHFQGQKRKPKLH